MSRRRPRIDIEGCQNHVGISDAQFFEELEHLQTCPILRYIQREPRVVENEYIAPGWKKVELPGVKEKAMLTYYWHVESGRLTREAPNEIADSTRDTPKAQMLKITESLKQDAISLAQESAPNDVRIHAAVLAQVAEALCRECESESENRTAWSSVARVLTEQRKTIQASCKELS